MRQKFLVFSVILAMASAIALAQHTPGAKFDLTKSRTIRGTVTQIDWANPNVHILLKVAGTPRPTLWAVEMEGGELELSRAGWTATTLKPGDEISVQGFSSRDGSNQISGNNVTLLEGSKRVFFGNNGTVPAPKVASGAVPRGPSGKPRLGPPPGETGYWGNPSRTYLVEDGVTVAADKYGLLKNIADAAKIAPMQPWAKGLYELRQRNFLKDDPMYLYCLPPGGPRQYQQPYGLQFAENPEMNRIFVLLAGGNRNRRLIYTDARAHIGQNNGDADNPLYYGRSVAKWDGDSLVVDVRGFNEKFWFDNGGLPHTDQLQLIEKFTRTDMKTMKYEVTINDPGTYTRPWKSTMTLEWIPGEETPYFLCQDNRP